MSRESVEVVLQGLEAFNTDDEAGFLALWDPECEFFSVTGSQMEATAYRGHQGIRQYLEEAAGAWTKLRLDIEDIRESGDDIVVVVGVLVGQGRASGVPVEQSIGMVQEVRDGKIRSCRAYSDPTEALEAAGLSE